jgi:hypothetical protein
MYQEFLKSMAGTSIGHVVSTNLVLFPTLETLHFVGLAMLVGGIAALDLRVLGVGKGLLVKPFHKLLPLVFVGFAINLVSGVLFFLADPVGYGNNLAFRYKMVFVLLAGLNALWFEFAVAKDVGKWGPNEDAPQLAKVICGLSLFLWAAIIVAGRMMPSFTALL